MPNFNTRVRNFNPGFTIVEVVIAITIISILSGALYSVVNIRQQRERTVDSVIRTNLQKTVEGLELYRNVENRYPTDANSDSVPENIDTYFAQGWLNGKPTGAIYRYWVDAARTTIGVTVTLNSTRVLKYHTSWAQIRECAAGAVPSNNLCPN